VHARQVQRKLDVCCGVGLERGKERWIAVQRHVAVAVAVVEAVV